MSMKHQHLSMKISVISYPWRTFPMNNEVT